MLAHFSRVLRNRPLLAVEHMMYLLLTISGIWGIHPSNDSLTFERLVNQFGVLIVVVQYIMFIVVGVYGHLSIFTVRIEQRIQTTRLAFLAFAFSVVANLGVFVFGGIFNPVSLMLAVSWALAAGITHLHLKMHQRMGAVGRWSYRR